MEVTFRQLNHLTAYLRRTQAGEEVTITSKGKVIAKLYGTVEGKMSEAEAIEQLESMPWVVGPRKREQLKGSDRLTSVSVGTTEEITRQIRGE